MASDTEEILGKSVDGQELLRLGRGLEPSHLSLPLSGRLVGDLRSIVLVLAGVVDDGRHDRPLRCSVTPQFVGDQPPGLASLTFQQLTEKAFSRMPIATRLDKDVDHVAVLIDGAPEIAPLTLDGHEEFVQVPRVTQATLSPLEPTGILGTEFLTPLPDGFVGNDNSALCQEILDISEAQAEAMVEPDGVADDLRRESVSSVARVLRFMDSVCQPLP